MLQIIQNEPGLQPFEQALQARHDYAESKVKELTGGKKKLAPWASGYLYFGLHHLNPGWVLREWAPNATAIYVKGDFNNWEKNENYRLYPVGNGVWEGYFTEEQIRHGQHYKLLVEWLGGYGECGACKARRRQ